MDEPRIRIIEDHPNYSISDDGKVYTSKNREKAQQLRKDGYLKANLYDGSGSYKTERIHRLVATAFVSNPDNKPDVNHKDGNKLNNHYTNLEWVTKSENMQHAYDTGLATSHPSYGMRGHKNPNGGKKHVKVLVVETGIIYDSVSECARDINGNDAHIHDCMNGKQKTHRGYHFERVV